MTALDRKAILDATRKITSAAAEDAGDNETGRGMELTQRLLDSLPLAIRKQFNDHIEASLEAGEVNGDPKVALFTLLKGNSLAPASVGSAPAASLSGMIDPAAIAAPVVDPTPSLSPEHQLLLDSFEGVSPDMMRRWADWARRSTRLHGDQRDGFPHLMENVLDGDVGITSIGEPLANEGVRSRDKQIRAMQEAAKELDEKIVKLTRERDKLKTDLENSKSAAASAPASNELMMATLDIIGFVNTQHGLHTPRINPTNESQVMSYLNNGFRSTLEQAVQNELTARRTAESERDAAQQAKINADGKADGLQTQLNEAGETIKRYVVAAKEARLLLHNGVRISIGVKGPKVEGRVDVHNKLKEITGVMPEFQKR